MPNYAVVLFLFLHLLVRRFKFTPIHDFFFPTRFRLVRQDRRKKSPKWTRTDRPDPEARSVLSVYWPTFATRVTNWLDNSCLVELVYVLRMINYQCSLRTLLKLRIVKRSHIVMCSRNFENSLWHVSWQRIVYQLTQQYTKHTSGNLFGRSGLPAHLSVRYWWSDERGLFSPPQSSSPSQEFLPHSRWAMKGGGELLSEQGEEPSSICLALEKSSDRLVTTGVVLHQARFSAPPHRVSTFDGTKLHSSHPSTVCTFGINWFLISIPKLARPSLAFVSAMHWSWCSVVGSFG